MNHFKPKRRSNLASLWRERPRENTSLVLFSSVKDNFEVYIHNAVLDLTFEAGLSALPHETMGLIAGRVCQDSCGLYAVVMAAEAAWREEIKATPSDVYISSGGYTQLRNRLELVHPVLEILGWFHSHPLLPPTPSSEDLIEQRTWTDHNSISLIVSLISECERFGVFHGPQSIPLLAKH
jgi:proteasome lid subunit RPN8/RPN11